MSRELRFALRTTVAIGFASLPAGVLAQDQATDEEAVQNQASEPGNEIVVTAQRRSEALERTPVAVAVVSGEELAERNITSERDLQFVTPGLTVRTSQNDNQLNYSLRGQTVDAYTSSLPSVLPYVNEVQVGGSAGSAFYDLQSVQVLKGPQGTLFGRNSTGGAVLFTTARPTAELDGYAAVRYGRFNDVQLEGAIGGPVAGDGLRVRVAGFYRNRDGYQYNRFYDEYLGRIDKLGLRGSVSINPEGALRNDLVVDYYRSRGSSISPVVSYVVPVANNVPGNPFVPNNIIFPGLVQFGIDQVARGPYDIDVDSVSLFRLDAWNISNVTTLELSDSATLKNIFGFGHSEYQDAGDIDGTRFGIDGRGNAQTGAFGGIGRIRQVSNELQLLGQLFNDRLEYVVGGYYSNINDRLYNTSFILNGIGIPPQINAGTTESESMAGYGHVTFDTGFAGFKFIGGLRYTSEEITFTRHPDDQWTITGNPSTAPFYADGRFIPLQQDRFNKWSWTVGLQNQVTPELMLYGASRRSFRSGGFNFHAPPTPGFANVSGGEFRPEIATDIELGAKYRGFAGSMPLRLNLALYNTWVEDIQRANYVAIFGALAGITVNVPNARIRGFELDGSIEPSDWLTIGGTLNYTDAEFTDPRVPVLGTDGGTTIANFDTYPDTPRWSGTLYADAEFPISTSWNLTLHGDVYNQSSNYFSSTGRSLNPNTLIEGYTLANFRVGIEEQGDSGWSFSALLKNAFDEVYYTGGVGFASLFALNFVVPGEPRTFLLEARYRF